MMAAGKLCALKVVWGQCLEVSDVYAHPYLHLFPWVFNTWSDTVGLDVVGYGMAGCHRTARRGAARHGTARHGAVAFINPGHYKLSYFKVI